MFEQFGKIIIDAGNAEIRFLPEGTAQVVDPVFVVPHEFHNGQDKIIGFVEGIEDFIAGTCNAAFHLDKPQFSRIGDTAFNVLSEFFQFPVNGVIAAALFNLHDDGSCFGCGSLGVNGP